MPTTTKINVGIYILQVKQVLGNANIFELDRFSVLLKYFSLVFLLPLLIQRASASCMVKVFETRRFVNFDKTSIFKKNDIYEYLFRDIVLINSLIMGNNIRLLLVIGIQC